MFGEITHKLDAFRPFRADDKPPLDVEVYGVATISYDRFGDWTVDRIDIEAGQRLIQIEDASLLFDAIAAELETNCRDGIVEKIARDTTERSQPCPDGAYERARDERMGL